MAILFCDIKWQANHLNFSAEAVAGGTTTFLPQTAFFPGTFNYFFNDLSGTIHLRSIAVTNSWSSFGDGTTQAVYGTGLTVDAGDNLTGGTAQALASFVTADGSHSLAIEGISVAVTDLIAAAATAGGRDDARLIRQMLAGNDLAGLSSRSDTFNSGSGIDLIFANGGKDRITLGAGMDAGLGGTGNDTVFGGAGDDLLIGNQGRDRLFGGADFDILDGGKGRDVLTGGAATDFFVFLPGDGHDRITDFDPAVDVISLQAGGVLADVKLADSGAGVVLTYHDNVIRLDGLAGVTVDDLDIRFGYHVSEARLQTFVNFWDLKG